MGAYAIVNPNYNPNSPSQNEPQYLTYNGLADAVLEGLHTLADTHEQATQANIGSLKSQAISGELLGAMGVPAMEKKIAVEIGDQIVTIGYPAFNGSAMTLANMHFTTFLNLANINEQE